MPTAINKIPAKGLTAVQSFGITITFRKDRLNKLASWRAMSELNMALLKQAAVVQNSPSSSLTEWVANDREAQLTCSY